VIKERIIEADRRILEEDRRILEGRELLRQTGEF